MDTPRLGSLSHAAGPVRARLTAAVVLGTVARLALSWKTPPQPKDAAIFGSWAETLRDHPLGEFYAMATSPDHLPGDLWFLKLLQLGFTASGHGDFGSHAFHFLLKAVPTTADVAIGVLLFHLVRTWASENSAVRAAQWYLLNPAAIMLSAVWGQWDAVSAAIVLTGFLIVVRGGDRWIWSAPLLVWALLIKPTLAIFAFMVVLWLVVMARPWRTRFGPPRVDLRPSLTFGAMAVATAVLILAPFRVGLTWVPPGGSSLMDRARYAADLYPFTTMGASNLWLVVDRRLVGPPDDVTRWGSLTPALAATILFVVVVVLTVFSGWRTFATGRHSEALLWSGAAATFGSCLVLTRVHERYYFPVLLLLLLWASTRELDVVGSTLYWVFSALFIVDLSVVIDWVHQSNGPAHRPVVLVVVGSLHLMFFLGLFMAQWWTVRTTRLRVGAPSAATAARRTAPG